jgi:ketosteroid isomerase-like protein
MNPDAREVHAQVLAADEARYQALYRLDVEALARMLADDYVHVHANGTIDDRSAFLASIRAARYRFVRAERTGQSVRCVGDVVLLHGRTATTLDVAGETRWMNNAFSTVWARVGGRLQLLHWQATKMLDG